MEEEPRNPLRVFDGEIEKILDRMLELAGADKSEHGKRQPGERCMYEIQREETHNNR